MVKGRQNKFCTAVLIEQRQTVMHYQREKSRMFLRIVMSTPDLVSKCRGVRALEPIWSVADAC